MCSFANKAAHNVVIYAITRIVVKLRRAGL